jgi:DNA-binding helix-hairpin-helix protein with protein kinase domain
MNYATATGRTLEFATRNIGRGGEGQVLPVAGDSALVAKVFHHPTLEHRAKLEFMVANPVPQARDHYWVTWPLDIIFTRGRSPKFVGYVMPRLTHAQPIFTFYNPAIRPKKSPGFDYRHLVHCGRNLAAAFNQAHAKRYVIGDPNESNAFVGSDARVTLIDADSWQLWDAIVGRTFHSSVAKPDFLPPELQNRSLKGLDRKPWHDNFALAVLLFKLTNEGNHPFDGVYRGAGDVPPLEARIRAGAFPYLDRSGRWSPKGLALQFDMLHPRLRELFVQAFETGHARPESRPNARVWQEAFTLAESELQSCHHNPHHWFWGKQCIWCQRKKLLGGKDPFPGGNPRATRRVPPAVPPVLASRTEPNTYSNSDIAEIGKFLNRNSTHPISVALVALVIVFSLAIFAAALMTLIALLNR